MNNDTILSMVRFRALSVMARLLSRALPLGLIFFLSGCSNDHERWTWIFNPNGPIATQSVRYLAIDIGLLLIIIIPATALTLWVLFRYRRGGLGNYDPSFNHSNLIEVFAWGVPLLIVGALSYYSVKGAEAVDAYHPAALDNQPAAQKKPLKVDVITTDWQWLFVYPKQGVALANKLVLPVNREIRLRMTSASITNDFYIQKLVGQIYIMPGMETKRRFLLKRPGVYDGYSMELSGPGYSWMHYKAHIVSESNFKKWVTKARASSQKLTYARFKKFAQPTVNVGKKSQAFTDVDPNLFMTVIRQVKNGKLTHYRPMHLTDDMNSELFKQHSN